MIKWDLQNNAFIHKCTYLRRHIVLLLILTYTYIYAYAYIKRLTNRSFKKNEFLSTHIPMFFFLPAKRPPRTSSHNLACARALVVDVDLEGKRLHPFRRENPSANPHVESKRAFSFSSFLPLSLAAFAIPDHIPIHINTHVLMQHTAEWSFK